MVFDSLFAGNALIGSAMNASLVRNDVIVNNLANSDVPNFKKSTVNFESILEREIRSASTTGGINLSNLTPEVKVVSQNYSLRLDGNNVDTETEMVELYKNSARFDTMTTSLVNNYKRINMALS